MRYLLDSNILSDLIRNPQGIVAEKIGTVGEENICTSIIVVSELRYGASKKRSIRLSAQLDAVLSVLTTVPYESPADVEYARIRTELEQSGTPIGGNDLLIAAQAAALECVLVTDNVREFSRVKNLKVENWLRTE
ncbi:MAG: VapC toxin family PIN domain ribonuclease [Candidatus Melainabacteria bacterium]|nr:MAG: VapC toxin family PIN domain ribonuclease [Candidatus Melainabacteria bacterium]